jgi:hypothetical protein
VFAVPVYYRHGTLTSQPHFAQKVIYTFLLDAVHSCRCVFFFFFIVCNSYNEGEPWRSGEAVHCDHEVMASWVQSPGNRLLQKRRKIVHKTQSGRTLPRTLCKLVLRAPDCPFFYCMQLMLTFIIELSFICCIRFFVMVRYHSLAW